LTVSDARGRPYDVVPCNSAFAAGEW